MTELWTYELRLGPDEELRLVEGLSAIPPLLKQTGQNLTGKARDLWVTGIRNIRQQRVTAVTTTTGDHS